MITIYRWKEFLEYMKKFDKDKYLKKLKFQRAWRKYERYFCVGVPCLMIAVLGIYIISAKVNKEDFISDDTIGAYIDGEYSQTIPSKSDGYVVQKIVCDNGAVGEWDNDKWGLLTTNMTQKSKCNVYFKSNPLKKLISQLDATGKCPTINEDGTINVNGPESENALLCSAPDAYGTSYYYRGNVTNNYVKFGKWSDDTPDIYSGSDVYYSSLEECQSASSSNKCTLISRAGKDMYWRIVRINGDGSIRMIYDGTSAHVNGESSEDRYIAFGTSFNVSVRISPKISIAVINRNALVGYMYGDISGKTYEETHANINNSVIKTDIDTWYENNIKGTTNEQYVLDNLFCTDRSFASSNSGTGIGNSATYYRWSNLENMGDNKITLKCLQKNDALTMNDTLNGAAVLKYGIGLITADEAVLAGAWNTTNNNYYLYINQNYWTMSASLQGGGFPYESIVNSSGEINYDAVDGRNLEVTRPVISLSSEVLAHGDGTSNNPYRLVSD